MNQENKSSNIVVIGGLILGFLGLVFIGQKIYDRNVGNNRNPDKNDYMEENIEPDISESQDKTKEDTKPSSDSVRNKESKVSFKDVDELLLYAIRSVLDSENFRSPYDFMSSVITLATVMCENDEWFEYFPKDMEELKRILEINNLLQEYNVKLYKNYV